MKDDMIMGTPISNPPERNVSRKVKDELMFNVLEHDMTADEKNKKQKEDYLIKGKE
ncbi:hypothetical protein BRE01_25840 [Brevibacillus reuszeri]|uniref:Uncharacterized protein n=1 Tax=Brevibacillus reuszeri TaxID=54915 RepID=A0ABQ0TM12_9BACL|nr:hypothetical protein [Brevibacillus reuszeri]MED1858126.1 hypothetical protein [Brevibacillus reuszeri]GED68882.1 hypothetical protein BRE01_25840 [Brevibacillus reuszeri]GIO05268.1 hypothetical protein J31TS6_12960 [Brevibacillus reuszeri]